MSHSISILELRRIEATILKDVYDTVLELHGAKEAEKIVAASVKKSAIAQGKSMRSLAKKTDAQHPDLEDFANLIPLWEVDGALEIEMLHSSKDRLQFNIRHCKYAQMYKEMGLGEIGHLLSCNRDAAFCIGYNPDMELTRTQTIMKGAKFCDFRYKLRA
ncbi:MAG: L-2-amino-thiazoline-4-carboxylic acid hydrolase [Xanthomonadales bacterium]|nr:L-2-amino-thiazoline-4-carboxylic acid hydrolase [Xanthomonadales bacterium]